MIRLCEKYVKENTAMQQIEHIDKEVKEISLAYLQTLPMRGDVISYAAREDLIDEITDVQTACATLLAILQVTEQEKADSEERVIHKNKERGYYE